MKTKREQQLEACTRIGWTIEGDNAVCPRCGARIRVSRQAAITAHHYGQSFRTVREIEVELAEQEEEARRLGYTVSHLENVVAECKRKGISWAFGMSAETASRDLRYCFRPRRKAAADRAKELRRQLRDGCHLSPLTAQLPLIGEEGSC